MSGLSVAVCGIGLLGPGLPSWAAARSTLRGDTRYVSSPAVLEPPARLPPAERRRAGPSIRLAMAVADQAVAQAQVDPGILATVFASSGGEGSNCHILCETLATPARLLSPTRFTNSVHNAAAGYWHIAVASRAASTSLSAYDGSFTAGLVEAATQVRCTGAPVLMVACDVPYPEPLNSLRPLPHHFGVALLLAPPGASRRLARLTLALVDPATSTALDACRDPELDALRRSVPSARVLPLLEAIAAAGGRCTKTIDYLPGLRLQVELDVDAGVPVDVDPALGIAAGGIVEGIAP
ncbi:MAG: beta-ketoacyl synthase chain length factor [Caldimonas sp.]